MPLAPALKGLLLASSLVAAGVAAYETDPNVRDFVENLEREFSPDGVGRSQIRRRRRERERERMAMDLGGGVGASRSSRGGNDGDVVVTASGSGVQTGQGREMRQRHRIEIMDAEDEERGVSTLGGDVESMHTSATHETLFDQFPASFSSPTLHNIPIDDTDDDTHASTTHRNVTLINDLNGNDDDEHDGNDDDMLASQTTTTSTSLDDLSDLDPFADPPIESITPLVLSMPRPSSHDNNQDRSPLTPTSFATSDSPRILTPVTPRTVASAGGRHETVSDSYFSDFSGSASGSGHEIVEQGSRRQSVASSGVGFETPDEDEDDVEWGRA